MGNPRVSVVIPAYNHERYVGEAIRSVLDQTFEDLELIIINDGSTDNTEAEILKIKDDRIRYYSQENRGLSATLNRGIELARGEFFNFLPSDDAFFPEKLEIQLEAFKDHPDLGVVFAYPQLVDAEGREIKESPAAQWAIVPFETKEEIFPALFERNFLSAPTALIRMECFKRVGGFDESLKYAQDYDLWMRILKPYDVRLMKQPLVKYRWHGGNLTFRSTSETESERTNLLKRAYHDLSVRELFPSLTSLRETDRPEDFIKAYNRWAEYLKGSGLSELAPFAEICTEAAKSLKGFASHNASILEQGGSGSACKRINLLMETRLLDRGGLEEVIFNIARHLDRSLFHIVIVCVERGGLTAERCRKIGIPVEILRGDKEKEYREILDRYQINLLVTHYSTFGIKMASDLEIPVITFLHNIYCWLPDDIFGEIKSADRMIDHYVAVSEDVKAYTLHRFNIAPEKVVVIPNGIDLEELEFPKVSPNLTRKDAGLEETDYLFLNVAAFVPAKAHPLILAAMKEVIQEYPEAKVICIGSGLDPKYEEFIRTRVKEYGLEKHVRLIHFTEDLHSYYQMADAFLLPSTIEGWSLAAMEAMAYGLPLILTRVGGASQVIEEDDIGLLVDNRYPEVFDIERSFMDVYEEIPSNVSSLKEAMLRFLQGKAYWKEAGKKGKEKVRERFDIRFIAKAYSHLFLATVALHGAGVRGRLVTQRENLLQERERLIKTQETYLKERAKEIQELQQLFEARYQQLDNKIEYVLLRMSVKERIRERFHKFLKSSQRFVPRRWRERYRLFCQRFFFENSPLIHPSVKYGTRYSISSHTSQGTSQGPEGINFLVFPIIDWELRYQRPQQIAERLANRGHRIFYFRTRPIVVSPPALSKKEIYDLMKIEEVKTNLYLVSLVSQRDFNLYQDLLDEGSLRFLSDSLDVLKDRFDIQHTVSIVDLPFWTPLVTRLLNNKIIYDCMDDHAGFTTNNPENMILSENELFKKTDLVLASSEVLFQKAVKKNSNTILVRNGSDVKHFSHLPESDVLKNIPRPVIGYHGAISEWFDTRLVARCAKAYPDFHFLLIGSTFGADLRPLQDLKNVHLLGEVPYGELPKYLWYFEVCFIPFKINPLTQAANPVKFYEYLSTGKPVVTVALPELLEYKFVCYYSYTEEEFLSNLPKALNEKGEDLKAERIELGSRNSWDRRVDQILEATRKLFPRVSIIIVTFNNMKYLKLCIQSIFRFSSYPNLELIVVDNHSQDGTRDYLITLQASHPEVRPIHLQENKGFAGGNNEGLKIARGAYIVFLNDDTVVTRDWVSDLVGLLEKQTRLGMIGPVSNNVGNIQKVGVGYGKDLDQLHTWARSYTNQQTWNYRAIPMLGFFCIMMKREVFEKVGFLDEGYEIGMFEDDDYCKRVRKAGYELGYTKRVFIHHEGGVSFNKLDSGEYRELWEKNRTYFEKKWNMKWSNDYTEFTTTRLKGQKGGADLREYHKHQLSKILEKDRRSIIIFPPLIDWYTPVFQRPPHIAETLAKSGYLVFFCTENQRYDKVEGFLELKDHLYLTDAYDLLKGIGGRRVIYFIYSTENRTAYEDWREEIERGREVVYEYIDEIHDSITGTVPEKTRERHHLILKDERFVVVATADKLYEEVLRNRTKNCVLATNGVEYEHFHTKGPEQEPPQEIEKLVQKKKPIIGYFGSLALWFDYDLVLTLAEKRPQYEILLIGYSYDGSSQHYDIDRYENITVIGPVEYGILPKYAHWFDVATIPFRVNEITASVSPIKLFEYMALGRSIVTTNMPECRKYRSVLIGEDHEDFIRKVDHALTLRDDRAYGELINQEALENTWESKVQSITKLLGAFGKGAKTLDHVKVMQDSFLGKGLEGQTHPIKQNRFEALLKNNFGIKDFEDVKDPRAKMCLNFALSTTERGEAARNLISQYTQIKGKRCLDVGCAYGGFLVAFKKGGASEVVGVDINSGLLAYCEALLRDHCLNISSYQKDILKKEDIQTLGTFDIITCNDVIEHVRQPDIAINHMASMLNENGVLLLEIPNKFFASFIQSDGHYNLFGITVLPKWIADSYLKHSCPDFAHDVQYKSLKYYLAALKRAGLICHLINSSEGDKDRKLRFIRKTFQKCRLEVDTLSDKTPADLRENIKKRVLRIINLFERKYELYLKLKKANHEQAEALAQMLIRNFGEDFWKILARKEKACHQDTR